MRNKFIGWYLIVFAILYFIFTVFIANHGVHFINSAITVGVLVWGIFMLKRDEK